MVNDLENIQKKRWGIFGGSFDPPHIAHTLGILYALELARIEKLLIIPCLKHPFQKDISSYEHRFNMCKIAFEIFSRYVEISDIEKERQETSYTIDTVLILKEKYPNVDFVLIIGSDILPDTPKWKNFDRVKKEVSIFVLPRPNIKNIEDPTLTEIIQQYPQPNFMLPDISSTQIRNLIKQNQPVLKYISKDVWEYIKENNLYINLL